MIAYKNILFCTDFSEDANIAFIHALDLAEKYAAKLHLLHVPHASYGFSQNLADDFVAEGSKGREPSHDDEVEKKAKAALEEAYGRKLAGLKWYVLAVKQGSPDVEIIRYAKKNDIDVIVMGALGKSELDRIEHGSTVANVSKYAHCHVIAIRNPSKRFTLPAEMY